MRFDTYDRFSKTVSNLDFLSCGRTPATFHSSGKDPESNYIFIIFVSKEEEHLTLHEDLLHHPGLIVQMSQN